MQKKIILMVAMALFAAAMEGSKERPKSAESFVKRTKDCFEGTSENLDNLLNWRGREDAEEFLNSSKVLKCINRVDRIAREELSTGELDEYRDDVLSLHPYSGDRRERAGVVVAAFLRDPSNSLAQACEDEHPSRIGTLFHIDEMRGSMSRFLHHR